MVEKIANCKLQGAKCLPIAALLLVFSSIAGKAFAAEPPSSDPLFLRDMAAASWPGDDVAPLAPLSARDMAPTNSPGEGAVSIGPLSLRERVGAKPPGEGAVEQCAVQAAAAIAPTESKQPSPPTPLPKGEGSQLAPLPKGEGREAAPLPKQDGIELPSLPTGEAKQLVEKWTKPEGLSSSIQMMLLLAVLSLAPAILLMTTCFVRVVVVLSLLRQAVGTQHLPPNQVITSLALFITLLVMSPVWKQVYQQAVVPYSARQIGLQDAWTAGSTPVRKFMSMQIERTGNSDDVRLFLKYLPGQAAPATYEEVPLEALLPAFMLSELKTAFLIGFQIYLPFLILDMVVAAVMVSMGMVMLPPALVSLPLKILLFVLVDGWHLVVGMLMQSFQPFM
jgi:flagellar biosynthesis protein FliP